MAAVTPLPSVLVLFCDGWFHVIRQGDWNAVNFNGSRADYNGTVSARIRMAMKVELCLLSLLLGLSLSACADRSRPQNGPKTLSSLEDASLQSYRQRLLDLAFDAVSAMPADPHIKSRSRAQETVIAACLELDQPQRARRYTEQIGDWRRGACYVALASYCAQHGSTHEAGPYLSLAVEIAGQAEDWQRGRIRGGIAQAYVAMGQAKEAATFEKDLDASEAGKVARARAMICPPDSFDRQMEVLGALASSKQVDLAANALRAYTDLFDRFYADSERRVTVENKIRASWTSLPIFIRIDLLKAMADFSLSHADRAKALELVEEARKMMDSASWQPRFSIPLMAVLAELRFRAGDTERARTEAREALDLFDAKRDGIVNIYRAHMLRCIAEAYQAMGDTPVAMDLYGRAVEAGMENPNSRPRAEDLAATCCSMALHAAEPGSGLWSRIRGIRDGLKDPW